jgi:hypothetical protein
MPDVASAVVDPALGGFQIRDRVEDLEVLAADAPRARP